MPSRPDVRSLAAIVLVGSALLAPALPPRAPELEVCHVPPGKTPQTRAVRVAGEEDLADHLSHGDTLFGTDLADDCSGGVAVRIDTGIEPTTPSLEGIAGGPPRPVAVLVGPDGRRDDYVEDEVDLKPPNEAALLAFLARYGGEVLRDDVVLASTADGELEERPGRGWYLVRIDPDTSPLGDLPARLAAAGVAGTFSFSSEAAARSFALLLREAADHTLTPNLVLQQDVLEHPLVTSPMNDSDYLDFATLPYMTDDEDPSGLSIGVLRAWEYLRQLGFPPAEGTWRPARLAMIDEGFSLDPMTGLGNADHLFNPPPQVDLVDSDARAGGLASSGSWHGEGVFGVCCATPRNRFGGAGRGGEYVRPIAIRAALGWSDSASAVWSAIEMAADVINLSRGGVCNWSCELLTDEDDQLESAIANASLLGITVVASAGNGLDNRTTNVDISDVNRIPCKLPSVVCVGAINANSDNNLWNWGSGVDIWAPTDTLSTVTPISSGMDLNDVGMDEVAFFNGTSAAAPFASGIVGLMKTVQPSLRWDDVQQILQDTANPSSSDPGRVAKGYVDALRAVQALRTNPAPSVSFAQPVAGTSHSWNRFPTVLIDVVDPPYAQGFTGRLVLESDRDGAICDVEDTTTRFGCAFQPSTPGAHVLTATASDPFGETGSATLSVEVTNAVPAVAIFSPNDGRTFLVGQPIRFTAEVSDFDETIGDDQITWTSSLDGDITPASSPRDFTRTLSVGMHEISLTAVDGFGAAASDAIGVEVVTGSGTPVAQIVFPPDQGILRRTETLLGGGFDAEDGELTGASLEWHGSRDGFLGTGSPLTATFTGAQTLTLRAIDSDGNVGTDQISFTIGAD